MKRNKANANHGGFRSKPVMQVVAVICAIFAISAIAYRFKGNASASNQKKVIAQNETSGAMSIQAQDVVVGGGEDSDSSDSADPDPESKAEVSIQIVGESQFESEAQSETEEATQASTLSAIESAWQDTLLPSVEDYLVVRASGSKEAEPVGKLYVGNAATVVADEGEWLKIQSGNMEGYVNSAYVRLGMDAYEYAMTTLPVKAKNNTDGLRVRSDANTDATILTVLELDKSLSVNKGVESPDGWVAVEVDNKTGYVKREFVELHPVTGIGITIAEEKAALEAKRKAEEEAAKAAAKEAEKKAAEAKKEKEKTKKAANAVGGQGGQGISVSTSEVDMLAAIIECEAGSEGYESKLAVGAVVVNRIQSSRFPNSMNEVLRQGGQFTPVATGQYDQVLARGASSSCYAAARDALAGSDNTGGCLFFRTANGREGLIIERMVFY